MEPTWRIHIRTAEADTEGSAKGEGAERAGNTPTSADEPMISARVANARPWLIRERLNYRSGAWTGTAALVGPFRQPWEFGYLMADPAKIDR